MVLRAPGDDPALHEVHQPVVEDAGMEPQVVLLPEGAEHRVGDGADAGLEGVAVPDEPGDVASDGAGGVVGLGKGERIGRAMHGDREVDTAGVDAGAVHRGGEGGVHLCNDSVRVLEDHVDEVAVETRAELGRTFRRPLRGRGHAHDREVEVEPLAEEVGHRP